MFRFIGTLLILISLNQSVKSQNLDSVLFNLFFNVQLSRIDTGVISYYKNYSKVKLTGYSRSYMVPRSYNVGDTVFIHLFHFINNSYIDPSFKSGELTVIVRKTKNEFRVSNLELSVWSNDTDLIDKTFQNLSETFSPLSSKKENFKGRDSSLNPVRTNFWNSDQSIEVGLIRMKHQKIDGVFKNGVIISLRFLKPSP